MLHFAAKRRKRPSYRVSEGPSLPVGSKGESGGAGRMRHGDEGEEQRRPEWKQSNDISIDVEQAANLAAPGL